MVEKLGKTPVTAEDFPAFIVNRILLPMINEAVYTLYEGVGTVESIDNAMKLGANHPMGPLALADFIGLDTCLSIMQVLYEGLADSKYRPCPLLVKYVEAGWLGRKVKRGFYDYRGETTRPHALSLKCGGSSLAWRWPVHSRPALYLMLPPGRPMSAMPRPRRATTGSPAPTTASSPPWRRTPALGCARPRTAQAALPWSSTSTRRRCRTGK